MRITFHIGTFTVTIIVKQRKNRHSGVHPVNRTVKYYKIFSGSSCQAAACFHAIT